MRRIFLEDGLNVRFPGRDEEFNQGVEIGIVATLLSSAQSRVTVWMSPDTVEQARALGEKMGFHLTARESEDGATMVTFAAGRARPQLRLVHSQPKVAAGGSGGRVCDD